MKKFKRVLTGLVILLIVLSVAGIIYVLQFQEESATVKPPKIEKKKAESPKAVEPKGAKEKPPQEKPVKQKTVQETPAARKPLPEKEKVIIAKITPPRLPLRQVAIIIDDIGHDVGPVRELLKIDADITFAILPLLSHTRDAAEMLHKARREILLHLPMEPVSYPKEKPGSGALFTDMNDEELLFQLEKDLASVPYASGVNNHMGSKFMADEEKLILVFKRLKKKKLFFIDSRTTTDSKTTEVAQKVNLPVSSRKIFLDNNRNYKQIYKILMDVANGHDTNLPIIMIGHPYPETIQALKDANRVFREKGIEVVPASRLIKTPTANGAS